VTAMREYTLSQSDTSEWQLRSAEVEYAEASEEGLLYHGPLLGAAELLIYLEDPSTPAWAADVAAWEDHEIDTFLRRLAVRPPSRKIDRLKRVVTLISEGDFPRPRGVA